ncbi:unnamed protein product [Leptidea sinapis]|uniref:Fatty acid desaturase domain-containing protein n=1 Tax=Leptidea sinapis TaxID=189913 RepID=A0A5E4R031_9NEOP|nr:unnamed protein product [Leptidea sinapis]
MPPNQSNGDFLEHSNEGLEKLVPGRITPRKYVIDYPHVALFGYGNAAACYGLYLAITKATWNTLFFNPHNASRGFFFSHIGWLLVKEHEEVEKRIKHVDMTDILSNPVLKFQYDLLPSTIIPVYFWGESLNVAWHLAVLRCTLNQHMTFLVNSAAHIWGNKPYDHSIKPAQNLTVSVASLGEGFHNYHHTFPWDYRAAELGNNCLNMTTLFIDFFKWIGWAYDLKTVDEDTIRNRAKRTGDGSDLWGLKEISEGDLLRQPFEDLEKLVPGRFTPRKYIIDYPHVALFGYGHAAACYGLYLAITKASWNTIFFNWLIFVLASVGVTAGAHRLWSHRAFKAKFPLQVLLMVMQTLSFQRTVAHWVRDHRLHHSYAEPFIIIISLLPPTIIPVYFWGESLNIAWHLAVLRCTINQHMTFLINSAAHIWGNKPYDRSIKPTQNLSVSVASFGEGFHNYHHTFPWDYRAAELGNNWLNMTTLFIDFFEWIGWAYDLKTVDKNIVRNRAKRTGDESDLWGLKKTFKKDNFKQKIFE